MGSRRSSGQRRCRRFIGRVVQSRGRPSARRPLPIRDLCFRLVRAAPGSYARVSLPEQRERGMLDRPTSTKPAVFQSHELERSRSFLEHRGVPPWVTVSGVGRKLFYPGRAGPTRQTVVIGRRGAGLTANFSPFLQPDVQIASFRGRASGPLPVGLAEVAQDDGAPAGPPCGRKCSPPRYCASVDIFHPEAARFQQADSPLGACGSCGPHPYAIPRQRRGHPFERPARFDDFLWPRNCIFRKKDLPPPGEAERGNAR